MATMTMTPGDIEMSAAQLTVGGTDIGTTNGGLTFSPTVTLTPINVDQSTMPISHRVTDEQCTVSVNLSEYNLDKMNLVTVGGTKTTDGVDSTKKKIEFGGGQISDSDYVELVITPVIDGSGTLDTDANHKITIWKTIPQTQPNLAFVKDGVRYIPTTFIARRDETKDAGKQFYCMGDTSAATA